MLSFVVLAQFLTGFLLDTTEASILKPLPLKPRTTLNSWTLLNATVQGRLQTAQPFARPCFQSSTVAGVANSTACSAIQANYLNHEFRVGVFGSFMNTEWEGCQSQNQQCTLDWQNPFNVAALTAPQTCSQGSVSQYFLEVQSAADVQIAFAFSALTNIPLSIKNTGHDYSGRSSQIGSLGLWTHNLTSMTYNPTFVPKGCSSKNAFPAVTQGAGVLHGDSVLFADAHNITLPGGADDTVGAVGGYLQGGGHSLVSNIYGLAVDRVLEFEVVTPDGQHLFANSCQNSDLFFALRGGGGGTFGVVLAATIQAFPKASFTTVNVTMSSTSLSPFLDFMIANSVQWSKDGWSGELVLSATSGQFYLTSTKFDQATALKNMMSLQTQVLKLNGTFEITTQPSYLALHQQVITSQFVPVGIPLITSSRLIPATTFSTNATELRDNILNIFENSVQTIIFANAPFSPDVFRGTGSTSVTPAWRNSIWHVTSGNGWLFNTPTVGKQAIYANVTGLMQGLRDLTPGSGAYHNEADVHEPNFSTTFWGDANYAKLLAIKKKYDPGHILDCWRCVDWSGASNSRFRCYL